MATTKKAMRLTALILAVALLFTLAACGGTSSKGETKTPTEAQTATTAEDTATEPQNATENNDDPAQNDTKTLVVYFSATGTTKGVAEQIASLTGADLYEITAAEPYTDDDLNWNDSNSRSTLEQNDKSVRPAIGSEPLSLDSYSTVFIGFPIWWGEEPRIMDTFVESYDFSGKTVIPFCTSSSSPIGSSASNLHALAPDAAWKDGRRFAIGTSRETIDAWLKEII